MLYLLGRAVKCVGIVVLDSVCVCVCVCDNVLGVLAVPLGLNRSNWIEPQSRLGQGLLFANLHKQHQNLIFVSVVQSLLSNYVYGYQSACLLVHACVSDVL
jgi:hypothetical protein